MANQYQTFSLNSPVKIETGTITVDKFWNQLKINTCAPAKAYFAIALAAGMITAIVGGYSIASVIGQVCIISCCTLFLMGMCSIPYAGQTLAWCVATCMAVMVVSGTVNTISCWMNGSNSESDDVVYIEE